ncbi:MAG: class I SAM-dependent methyltransferase [Planctomycetia bacterium]|nr:class I SAM-dependent methyltransferase [Planctomycetia bacterium]
MNDFTRVPPEFAMDLTLDGLDMNSKDLSILRPRKEFDWDDFYRQGTPPWDTGILEPNFKEVVESGVLQRHCSVLELGCGSGIEAIYMALKRFEVTAIDCSAMAIDRAHSRAREKNAWLRIVHDDIFRFCTQSKAHYDFVYDIGFYHYARNYFLSQYVEILWKVTKPGSYFFTLAGSDEETFSEEDVKNFFLPTVNREDIHEELGSLFEVVYIKEGTIYSRAQKEPYKAWACLFRRPLS